MAYNRNEKLRADDKLHSAEADGGQTSWDYKGSYIGELGTGADKGEGLERFSQFSASPDTTIFMAGPARYTGTASGVTLTPIGMADGISIQSNAQLARLYEIGSSRSFFSRGKTGYSMSMSRMLADTASLLAVLAKNAYRPVMDIDGSKAPGAEGPNPDILMNLDSEYFAVPFGLMMIMKTRGGGPTGKILTASYLENCMIGGHNFGIGATSPVISESCSIEFDRMVPVSFQ